MEAFADEGVAPQSKKSRTGRVIVPPASLEGAVMPAKPSHAGKARASSTDAVAHPEKATPAKERPQKHRRKPKKAGARVEWPLAAAEQLAAVQKVCRQSLPEMYHQIMPQDGLCSGLVKNKAWI